MLLVKIFTKLVKDYIGNMMNNRIFDHKEILENTFNINLDGI